MSIGIDSVASMMNQTAGTASNSKANELQDTLKGDMASASDEELMSVCKEFEAYFVEQVLKEVKKTIPESEEKDASMSQLTEFYEEEMLQNLSSEVCEKQNLGLAQQMYEQMKRNYGL